VVGTAKFDTSEINTLIRKHWRKEFKNGKSFHYWPMQYPSLNKHCFLFVGLNPSLKAKDKEAAEFVLESKESLLDIARMTEIIDKDEEYRGGPDRNKKCGYPICQEIFRELNKGHKRLESWDYIDLFSNRILKASDLKKELDIKDSQRASIVATRRVRCQTVEDIQRTTGFSQAKSGSCGKRACFPHSD